jgi:riboflavin kinase/FMN adenylyltransferase
VSAVLVRIEGGASAEHVLASDTSLVIGNFDGVHRGHQAVLTEAIAQARSRGWAASVLTFDPPPAAVVGGGAPPALTTLERRTELLGRLGVDRVYVRVFDAAFAAWPPERFAKELVSGLLCAKAVVVGENFRFGAKRAGDLGMLRELGRKLGFEAIVHGVAGDARGAFSSTRIREAIARGDLQEAATVLGRPHALSGVVGEGDRLGRKIGFPTANLEGVFELLPPYGVYAVVVDELGSGGTRPLAKGVMNIGVRPTVSQKPSLRVEAHLFDFERNLYGTRLRTHLVSRLRDEKRFESLDALKAQIAKDAEQARAALEHVPLAGGL